MTCRFYVEETVYEAEVCNGMLISLREGVELAGPENKYPEFRTVEDGIFWAFRKEAR